MEKPIGVFDSGVGGLTVVKEIRRILPRESILYFGDTARLPYGDKSEKTILDYSLENGSYLFAAGVKMIVVACNTSTAIALDTLRQRYSIPIVGVIEPGSREAVRETKSGRIGVIATVRTVKSAAYTASIKEFLPTAKVISKACPLLVPLIENAFANQEIVKLILAEYLDQFSKKVDTLVLGCTHYPFLKRKIRQMYPYLNVIDSAQATASYVKQVLCEQGLESKRRTAADLIVHTTDLNEVFSKIFSRLFGKKHNTQLVEVNL